MESNTASSNEPHNQQAPKEIVCLYAMRDEPMYRELQTHLILWHTKGHIRWLEVSAGADVEQTLLAFVQQADCVLLLISSSFFATSLHHRVMESALAEQVKRGVPVVPILARAFDWKESACGSLKALPDNELPIAEWEHQERAYENIRAGLVRLIPGLATQMASLLTRPQHFQARDLPKGYVARPKAFDEIKSKLLSQRGGQTTAITTALRGAGGFGKTTLALALCHDVEIQAAFPDGILWVDLGEQPPWPLDVLIGVLASLGTSLSGAITLKEARDRWCRALNGQVCLLVIDDVWQATALEPLLEGGPHCVRLITTRNDQVLPEEATRIWVDAMEPGEALAVLCRNLPEEIHQAGYHPRLVALVTRLGCWPLLLTLANGMITSFMSYGQNMAEVLTVVEQAYQSRGVMAFHLDQASERQRAADACLEVSVQHLEEFTPPHYHAAERYQELAVFPEDTDIPITTLAIFWKGTGGLDLWEVKDLCIRLHRLSLLLTCDLGKGVIRLHDVLRSYLEQRARLHLPKLHARLLNTYWQVLDLKSWADLPPNDAYLWRHLILHLCQTDRTNVLQATLTDLDYLIRKALYVSVLALEADLLLASTRSQRAGASKTTPFFFRSLHGRIMRISHLLQQAQTIAEMGGLLLSHLGWEPTFAPQWQKLEHELPRPFVTAWYPLPQTASKALVRTLYGHTRRVSSCTVSPDSSFIVSASKDQTLKVWDVTTGRERFSLTGHTGWVSSCAVSPDSSFIVSASDDQTLKVWDAATGRERFSLTGHRDAVLGCSVSPDGNFIVSASADSTLKVWDVTTRRERFSLIGHTSRVSDCAVSPDGNFIVSASADSTLKMWDVATGQERFTLTDHTDTVLGCAVSPDGKIIVSASDGCILKVWDVATGRERFTLTGPGKKINSCAVSPDSSFIVSASADGALEVWDVATGRKRFSFTSSTEGANCCAVSPDGRWIVSASDGQTLKVWDMASKRKRFTLTGHTRRVNSCAVSPDGSFIISASADSTLKMWNAQTGRERFTLTGHTEEVNSCAVSPDGSFIISASADSTLKVWNAQTGQYMVTFPVDGKLLGCAFHPDGEHLVARGAQGVLFLRLVV